MTKKYFEEIINLNKLIKNNKELLKQLNDIIIELSNCLNNGNKILLIGNGGSAADAQHFSAEIVGHYKNNRKGYPAIALNTNNSIITACANDFGYNLVFSRQVEAFGKTGDVLISISTSGNSSNIVQAVKLANKKGLRTISLLGSKGGRVKDFSKFNFIVPTNNTSRIQEIHSILIHIICEEIEKKLI